MKFLQSELTFFKFKKIMKKYDNGTMVKKSLQHSFILFKDGFIFLPKSSLTVTY